MKKFKINLGAGAFDIVSAKDKKNAKKNYNTKNFPMKIKSKYIKEI